MDAVISGPLQGQSAVCVSILRALPEWFGIEEEIRKYEQEIDHLSTFLAQVDGGVVGFLSLKPHFPSAAEIHVMGVHPDAHRRGIGRALVTAAEVHALELGAEYIQVKTLAASHPSPEYARTRAFYESLGFRPLEVFPTLWDEKNPCLLMVKQNSALVPRVGVGVIITRKDGRILLVHRKNYHGAGTWSTPGGHMDFGETPQECAFRETREEVGVEITEVRFRALTNDVFKDTGKHYVTLWMESHHFSGEAYIAADYEASEIGWFARDALPEPLFPPFENLVKGNCLPPGRGV